MSKLKRKPIKLIYTANCKTCNPVDICEPVVYDDPEKRDRECQEHANQTGHSVDVGFLVL